MISHCPNLVLESVISIDHDKTVLASVDAAYLCCPVHMCGNISFNVQKNLLFFSSFIDKKELKMIQYFS